MIGLLERAAAAAAGRTAVDTAVEAHTFAGLLDGARRVATGLRERGITRFAVAEADAPRVVMLLAGAALAGAEPCQYQPDLALDELRAQTARHGHDLVVTGRTDLVGLATVAPDELRQAQPAADGLDPDASQPLLIRTTGSTGEPKAVRHDWRVLARTVADVAPRPDQRWLLAYGMHQFAGIQVLQHVLAAQAALVAPFPRQPRHGLQALLDQQVTCVSATPTYWRFLLAEARSRGVALPVLEQITLGGEASPPDLLEQLRVVFPGARISQVYASTEFGSVASSRDGRPGFPLSALFGEDNPDGTLQVRDGELWVRAKAGMLGYADGPAVEAGEWRPTGDLAEIVGDRVLFRGRISEVINVGGVKVHPLPVEERIAAVEGVGLVRVFGRQNRLMGSVVAAEVVPAAGVDPEVLRDRIRDAVADLPKAWRPMSVKFVDDLATVGGKTLRREDS
ncbi:MAG: AMP-binding protein [Jatrophihabitans sp.]|uniref:AMP-binding protein n=1 Tax=Jatrophihabitans sp. TaxID=1932789 RepID=UPI003F7EC1AD